MKLLYIDLFCGAGGTSTGVNSASIKGERCAEVIACVNHDANAIASHTLNHPKALHFTEDIRTFELSTLIEHIKKKRNEYPDAFVVLWASIECTNFSKAKGGKPRDADSRTLAEHLLRYVEAIGPDYLQVENVVEFMSWGDIDERGKPISMDRGRLYRRWVTNVCKYGYHYEYRILNSADFGAYTSRKRFFGIFAKDGLPIFFPEPTHSKMPQKLLSQELKPWKPVKDVLDLNDEGISIFMRRKKLSENTLERIYSGLLKFVAGGKGRFIIKWNSMSRRRIYKAPSVDEPCPTVVTQNRLGMVSVHFLSKQYSGHPDSKNTAIDNPAGTITCIDHHAFVSVYYGNGRNCQLDEPAPTLTTKDRLSLVTCQFLDMPCFTLIARMDKMPPYLITTEIGNIAICITDMDSPMTVKIKEFMALYGIVDIKMRMLKIDELKRIMGFPDGYILVGTKAEQKKFIGNAVEVNMARVLCEALYTGLNEYQMKTA